MTGDRASEQARRRAVFEDEWARDMQAAVDGGREGVARVFEGLWADYLMGFDPAKPGTEVTVRVNLADWLGTIGANEKP